jgi:hypothetical protein
MHLKKVEPFFLDIHIDIHIEMTFFFQSTHNMLRDLIKI